MRAETGFRDGESQARCLSNGAWTLAAGLSEVTSRSVRETFIHLQQSWRANTSEVLCIAGESNPTRLKGSCEVRMFRCISAQLICANVQAVHLGHGYRHTAERVGGTCGKHADSHRQIMRPQRERATRSQSIAGSTSQCLDVPSRVLRMFSDTSNVSINILRSDT